jgi:putative membrane protein
MLDILIAILIGIICGIISGLIPGVHINLVSTILFIQSAFFLSITSPLVLAVFIMSLTITHTFIDFLPSIFLGAPEEDTALSILPGHRMLMEGRGYEAIKLTSIGCLAGVIIAIILSALFIPTAPLFYPFLSKIIAFLLISLSLFLILKEKKGHKLFATFVFILAGILGYAVMNLSVIKQPLFPLFTGLFGTSLLMISFFQDVKIPKQSLKKTKVNKKDLFKSLSLSVISSSLVSFLPGLGAAQAGILSSSIKKIQEKSFLILLGAVNTITVLLSFVALYAIKKPRSGVAVFVGKFLPNFSLSQLIILLLVALIVGIILFPLTLFLARKFTRIMERVNYKWLCFGIIVFLIILTPIISGWLALIVLITSTCLGIFCSLMGIKKIFLMGSLILPVIIWYLI